MKEVAKRAVDPRHLTSASKLVEKRVAARVFRNGRSYPRHRTMRSAFLLRRGFSTATRVIDRFSLLREEVHAHASAPRTRLSDVHLCLCLCSLVPAPL